LRGGVTVEIVWQGQVVGELKDANAETITPWGLKDEGDFVAAEGPVATEFRRRLDSHESIEVMIGGRPCVLYGRPDGRAKFFWPTKMTSDDGAS
jgi:hypothetical protein